MRGLTGRVALVTGGTGLLGSAVVARLIEEGARVGVTSRNKERVLAWAGERGEVYQSRIVPLEMDLCDESSRKSALESLAAEAGAPSILVANASHREALTTPFDELQPEDLERLFTVDVSGHVALARDLVKACNTRPVSVVLVSSIYATVGVDLSLYPAGMPGTPIQYVAAKSALLGVTRFLAAKWGPEGVRVNSVVSGGIRNAARQSEEFVQRFSNRTMLGRMAAPEEVAAAVAFLASDDASYITGHHLVVDGGFIAW